MIKLIFYSILIALTTARLILPGTVRAEDQRRQWRPQPGTIQPTIRRPQQLEPAVGYHRYTPPPPSQPYNYGSYRYDYRLHGHGSYPHGHRLHVHGRLCPVVIAPHVYVVPVPIPRWQVYSYPRTFNTGQAMLQIIVPATEGEIYVDDYYLGPSHSLQGRPIDFPVLPGWHVVYFVYHGNAHSHEVYVEADSTAVVQASLQ